jgi:hypothetical protein
MPMIYDLQLPKFHPKTLPIFSLPEPYNVIARVSIAAEKLLMIDLCVVKQACERSEVDIIGFVHTEHNPADLLTRIARCSILERIITTANLLHPVEKWIERRA